MPHTHSSLTDLVGASFMTASLTSSPMPPTDSSLTDLVGASFMTA
eukprot:CAMPEP_0201915982 /NCGR_PEP_ID=MMETSP0903-20130614/5744_1 /ASSEMBLY_ACC=CAM_ASM_000552 /TAXON_ID=420261 /ORGANISM="Thalassiosira antarctica, Strain CCMP982" /LENGTH=44 /DNA_ID= /DNA_START= /DNA_END= /DNA_ORIENTATION=